MLSAPGAVASRTIEGARTAVSPSRTSASLAEYRNKGEVYGLVRANELILRVPRKLPHPFPLEEYLPRALKRNPYASLFALEGLGRLYGTSYLKAEIEPKNILHTNVVPYLPESARLVLHAGIGLSFAKVLLDRIANSANEAKINETVQRIVGLCRDNSEPSCLGAALEALGLVVRCFHPQMMAQTVKNLEEHSPDVLPYFWHGAGRAIYFTPGNFLPFSTWNAIQMAKQLGKGDKMIQDNAISGVISALVMVNVRSPEVLAHLVIDAHGKQLLGEPGVAHGVATSIIMREITTPGASFIDSFLKFNPARASDEFRENWEQIVGAPSQRAVDVYAPAVKAQGQFDVICKFDDLENLTR